MQEPEQKQPGSGSVRLRVLGIPVEVLPGFWLATLVLGSTSLGKPWLLLEWMAVVTVSVLVHELGHALVARRLGRSVRIRLHALGGTTFHDGGEPTWWGRGLIALAGPLAGLSLGALVYGCQRLVPVENAIVERVVRDALWVNWGYGLLNLLPILPLDGGDLLQQAVDAIWRRPNEPAANGISLVLTAGLLAIAVHLRLFSLLVLFCWIAFHHARRLVASYRRQRDRALDEDAARVDALLAGTDGRALAQAAEELLARARSPELRGRALHALAWGRLFQYDLVGALDALQHTPPPAEPDQTLLDWLTLHAGTAAADLQTSRLLVSALLGRGQLEAARDLALSRPPSALDGGLLHQVDAALFYAGRYSDSLDVSRRMALEWKIPNGGYNAGCALVRLGDRKEALDWLERGVALGFSDHAFALADEDLAPLRDEPRFQALIERMKSPPP